MDKTSMNIPKPPRLDELTEGTRLVAGMNHSTIIADIDFETYSEAGFIWDRSEQKYHGPPKAGGKGLPVIGTPVYSEHPSTEILCMAYDLKDGKGRRLWVPTEPFPLDLEVHISNWGLIEAWNVGFERWIWNNVCRDKYNFPEVQSWQWRCAAAKARAFGLPGSLDKAGTVMDITHKKDKDGKRLLNKFSMPRNPTKNDPRHRIIPGLTSAEYEDTTKLYQYNLTDIAAEAELSSLIPDLSPEELEFWQCDQRINVRGVQIDLPVVKACIAIVEQAHKKYNAELRLLTRGRVQSASEVAKIRAWLIECGVNAPTLDAEVVEQLLRIPGIHPDIKRILQIREMLASTSVKKLYAMINQVSKHGRLHDLFIYHAARTGRAAGAGPQPQNLPNSGPDISRCNYCKKHFSQTHICCPWCGLTNTYPTTEWNPQAVNDALETIVSGNLECVEYYWGNAIEIISSCLRGMFISAPGKDLICSDYSAIEAVVLAALAGENWRMEVFRTHGMIYETSASRITGTDLQEYIRVKKDTDKHHSDRKLGKVAELASGYGGWIGAWKAFGADSFMTEEQIKQAVLAWRAASPAIVEFWGGQMKTWYPKMYGLEGAAVQAVLRPGSEYNCRGIKYIMRGDALYCRLLSGRYLVYHRPRLSPSQRKQDTLTLTFEGWNSNPKYGAPGWIRMETYGGKLTENVVQATARDLLAHAIIQLEREGYPVVLHIHDEIVVEVPEGEGSIEEVEKIMSTLPPWASGWPVKAKGGWCAKRYAK